MSNKSSLTDIHTHILPFIDDGAENLEESVKILRQEKASGVDRVILTPHYYCHRQELDVFLSKRDKSFKALQAACCGIDVPQMRLGAEVRYSTELMDIDIEKLTLGGSRYILIELSGNHYPVYISEVFASIISNNIVPIIAHAERCRYFSENPARLHELISGGALAQVSAESIIRIHRRRFPVRCLKKGDCCLIASDTHNIKSRPPCLAEAMRKVNPGLAQAAEKAALCIWNDKDIYGKE